MSFNLGNQKTTSSFTSPAMANSVPQYQLGNAAGDAKATKLTFSGFGTPTSSTGISLPGVGNFDKATVPSSAISTTTGSSVLPQLTLGSTIVSTSAAAINFSSAVTTAPSTLFTLPEPQNATALATSVPGFSSSTATVKQSLGAVPVSYSFGGTTTGTTTSTSSLITATTALASSTTQQSSGVLTFAQLEDAINKWTIDLEEQGKYFGNQAKQINAWDRLLISNGEKILTLNSGIERVKHQQQQLDQELDFVLAQQKELEDLIVPLEKDLCDIPVTDLDRNHTYQMAESLDSQLKQMSEDLKEIIEHLNEANKNQELSNPIIQIGRILNAHMNSLQWIDRNTTKINSHLDQISKMHDMNKRNHEINLQKTYD